MTSPLITWSCIVGLFIIILLIKLYRGVVFCSRGSKEKILSFMSEREEFYIPGDPNPRNIDEYDCEDFDDI